ncbi:MAG: hypothetical protein LWY06_10100 [Firmicutes bacterium]|nr:hypothetical protein [Bacillota bacterium]
MNRIRSYLAKNKGSILLLSIMLLFILLTLALSITINEFTSRKSSIRSLMSATQEQAVHTSQQRFLDAFSATPVCPSAPPIPQKTQVSNKPKYNISFQILPFNTSDFRITGTWQNENSIYYPLPDNPGQDFTSPVEGGYYNNLSANSFGSNQIPPGYNIIAFNTPLQARYIAAYASFFPYGAFAPGGKIQLRDAYGCTNPLDELNSKNGDFYSGVPVNMFAQKTISIQDYPYGKAYSSKGSISITGTTGAIPFTSLSPVQINAINQYSLIFQQQMENAYVKLTAVALSKDSVMFGAPVTGFASFVKGIFTNYLTLEQCKSFPFAGMTCSDSSPREKTMGCYYSFKTHAPYPPDNGTVSADPSTLQTSAKRAYEQADVVQKIFENYDISWKVIPTEACLAMAEGELAEDIATTTEELADAIEGLPETAILVAYLTAKLAKLTYWEVCLNIYTVCFGIMRGYEVAFQVFLTGHSEISEPLTLAADASYNNTGWSFVGVCSVVNQAMILETLNQDTNTKYALLGTELMAKTEQKYRLAHFGSKDFVSNFTNINSQNFQFTGTYTVPRGRTMKFAGNVTINGDLWVQDGGFLYVGGNLTVNAPSNPDTTINEMMRPSGRVFLGNGSNIIVENNFTCAGSEKYGSVVAAAPTSKTYLISSSIYSNKGDVTIPYGITPGVTVEDLADLGALIPKEAQMVRNLTTQAANLVKESGPFHSRKPFFASNATYLFAFRHKQLGLEIDPLNLPLLLPLKLNNNNVLNTVMQIMTDMFSITLNAYIGENFFAHSPWWIFGEGVVPILPNMDFNLTSKVTNEIVGASGALVELYAISQIVNKDLFTGTLVLDAALVAEKAIYTIYAVFLEKQFANGCDTTAQSTANNIQKAAGDAYLPFKTIVNRIDGAGSTFSTAKKTLNTFYSAAQTIMSIHLPGGLQQKPFINCPGVLVYAGDTITMGVRQQTVSTKIFPASGLLMAYNDINIYGNFRMVGCLISLNGDIIAENTRLRFFPYFTQASLYTPKDVGGNLRTNFKLISDSDLKSNVVPQNIGITIPRITSEGWDYYCENPRN